jgi:hypothetical protein
VGGGAVFWGEVQTYLETQLWFMVMVLLLAHCCVQAACCMGLIGWTAGRCCCVSCLWCDVCGVTHVGTLADILSRC